MLLRTLGITLSTTYTNSSRLPHIRVDAPRLVLVLVVFDPLRDVDQDGFRVVGVLLTEAPPRALERRVLRVLLVRLALPEVGGLAYHWLSLHRERHRRVQRAGILLHVILHGFGGRHVLENLCRTT